MNIFDKLANAEWDAAKQLGTPAADEAQFKQRKAFMASLNPKGFRDPKKEPRKDAQGKTRGDRKRERYAAMIEKIKDERVAANA